MGLVAAGLLLIFLPLAPSIPALLQLATLAAVLTGALVVESLVFADARHRIREELAHH